MAAYVWITGYNREEVDGLNFLIAVSKFLKSKVTLNFKVSSDSCPGDDSSVSGMKIELGGGDEDAQKVLELLNANKDVFSEVTLGANLAVSRGTETEPATDN